MRADRLIGLLMLLQTRGRMTARRLSEELEVSERTIYRDIYALRVAGFPVCTDRGPDGGCYLEEGFRDGLTALKDDELTALFLASAPSPLVELGMARDFRAAFVKLAGALPAARRRAHERVRHRIHLDTVPWEAPQESVPHLGTIHRAVVEDRWLRVVFARARRRFQSERLVAPFGLVAKTTTWYLVWSGKDAQLRVDHVSRVIEASLTAETFDRPESFNLAAFWEDWCRRQEENRPRFLATLRASLAVLPAIEDRFGDAVARIPAGPFTENEKGWAVVRVPFSSVEQARSHILAYGGAVEVLEPRALRLTVADFAGQIRKRYRKRG